MKVQKRKKSSLTPQQLTRLSQQRGSMILQGARPLSFSAAAAAALPSSASSSLRSSPNYYAAASSPIMSTTSSQRSNSVSSDAASMPPPPIDPKRTSPRPSSTSTSALRQRSTSPRNMKQLIDTLSNHRVNTITELCRIERIAAACTSPDDARAFQGPMTSAWVHYVESNQLLSELRGLSRGYPFSAELIHEANRRVRADPKSNRSWNLAWLCLVRIRDDGLIADFSVVEASKSAMWGGMEPTEEDVFKLSGCFSREWTLAVTVMLKHWPAAPAWY